MKRFILAIAFSLFSVCAIAQTYNYFNLNTGQLNVGNVVQQIVINRLREVVKFTNAGVNNCYLGNSSSVSSSTGYVLSSNATVSMEFFNGAVYGVCAASPNTVSFMEIY
jgi:hypothetical protein